MLYPLPLFLHIISPFSPPAPSKSRVSKMLLNTTYLVFNPDTRTRDQSADDIWRKIFHIIHTLYSYLFFL